MKTLKFRIWDDILKVMYTPGTDEKIKNLWEIPKLQGGVMKVRNGIKVMQFIRLQDKNGKDIYEGDIIGAKLQIEREDYNFIGSVIFENCKFTSDNADFELWIYDELEIIGNIHENPELIK